MRAVPDPRPHARPLRDSRNRRVELRHLRYFVAVAQERHFRRAAANLNISQPPLSQQIHNLEEELGVQLLLRIGRRVELTSAGRVFLSHAERILQSVEKAAGDARRAQQGAIGKLAVGFIGSSAYSVLPWILSSFRSSVPEVELELHQQSIAEQVKALVEGQIDVGVLRSPISDSRLSTRGIFVERFVAALPATHRLAIETRISLRDLANEDFVVFPPQPGMMFYNIVHGLCQKAGFAPRIVQTATPMQTVIGLVRAGIGISLVPQSVRQLNAPDIVYIDIADEGAQAELALAWRHDDASDVLRVFIAIATATAQRYQKGHAEPRIAKPSAKARPRSPRAART